MVDLLLRQHVYLSATRSFLALKLRSCLSRCVPDVMHTVLLQAVAGLLVVATFWRRQPQRVAHVAVAAEPT